MTPQVLNVLVIMCELHALNTREYGLKPIIEHAAKWCLWDWVRGRGLEMARCSDDVGDAEWHRGLDGPGNA